MAVNYILALLTACAIAHSSWAIFCFDDSGCPSHQLCNSFSCSTGWTGTGIRCNRSSECSGSSICLWGECSCRFNSECVAGKACSSNGRCINSECSSSYECTDDKICSDNRCVGCSNHGQCPGSLHCIGQRCKIFGSCILQSDCPGVQRCIFSICRYPSRGGQCHYDVDCLSDQRCNSYNRCSSESSETPSGHYRVDSGPYIFWGIVIFVAVVLKVFCFGACREANSGAIVPPPRTTASRSIAVPTHRPPFRIQMPSAPAPSVPDANFDSKPPAYNEAIAGTPSTPPPAYNPSFPK